MNQSFILAQIEFSSQKLIDNTTFSPKSLYTADLDGDNNVDILIGNHTDRISGDRSNNKITWYKSNGNNSFSEPNKINAGNGKIWFVTAGDLDGDFDLDIIASWEQGSDYLISWYRNIDGTANFSEGLTIQKEGWCAGEVYAKDIDGDSDLDIVYAIPFKDYKHIAWNENIDGNGTFSEKRIIASNINDRLQIFIADVDNDNDLDVVSACYENKITWHENTDGKGTCGGEKIISNQMALCVIAADLDHDGDNDILYGDGYNEIGWFDNSDGQGNFNNKNIITNSAQGINEVYTADLDNDDDLDVISASLNIIAVYENTDGKGTFGNRQIISNSVSDARVVNCADFDNDNDLDIASVSTQDNKVAWYENLTNPTSVQDNKSELPNNFQLQQNYPNPFNPQTTINYQLSKPSNVIMKIYNLAGQELETLVNGSQKAGEHEIDWRPEGLSSGIYFYRLQSESFSETKKLILQK